MAKIWVSQSTGCWVDLYERPGFRGRRLRLYGPASYVNLRVASGDWSQEAGSVVVGPAAFVQCFEEFNFLESMIWFTPGQRVADVAALPTEAALDSLRVFDRPPFATEPGFEAYARSLGDDAPPPLKLNP